MEEATAPTTYSTMLLRLGLGQFISFVMSCTGVCSALLVRDEVSIPLLQSVTAYFTIFCVFGALYVTMKKRRGGAQKESCPVPQRTTSGEQKGRCESWRVWSRTLTPSVALWKYALIAVVDLEANYLAVLAYQYTDLTSVQLLDCSTIPMVAVLSVLVLHATYDTLQVVGGVLALAGIGLLVVFDVDGVSRSNSTAPDPLKGDLLTLGSSACYAVSNVACEFLLKPTRKCPSQKEGSAREAEVASTTSSGDGVVASSRSADEGQLLLLVQRNGSFLAVTEYLCFVSLFGLLWALTQFAAVEADTVRTTLHSYPWRSSDSAYQILFSCSMLVVYGCMPMLFLVASATFANLSLLTSDAYSIVWNVTVFHINPKPLFCLPYALILLGITMFDTNGFKALRGKCTTK